MADKSGLAIVNLSKQNYYNYYSNLASKVLPQVLDNQHLLGEKLDGLGRNQQATVFTLKEILDYVQKISAGVKGFKYKETYDGELDNHVHLVPGLRRHTRCASARWKMQYDVSQDLRHKSCRAV